MNTSAILFYAISAFILSAGMLAVTSRQIFRSAIWLLGSLVGIAALYFWMQVEFIAAVQIIVYVGGIAVLIIFSVFLTAEPGNKMPVPTLKKRLASLFAALFGLAFSYNLIAQYGFNTSGVKPFVVNVSDIGTQLLSPTEHGYILPFEVVSILLLAAMIGCIVIAMKPPEEKEKELKKITVTPIEEPVAPVQLEKVLIAKTLTAKEV